MAGVRIDRREMGLSLVELLVSVTILAIAFTIALVVYDESRRSFKVGENVSEQQQSVRVAFDLVSSDVRNAGYNSNPDGNKARPDEPIEATYDTAIVIRADFDAGDPVASLDPEQTLGGPGSAFLTVTTGNDEIRAYVLAKPDGSSTGTLTFQADVGQTVRDGTLETANIPNVALVQDDPPYTLYRVSLANDASPQKTVLIENVRSLRFVYYDTAGNVVLPVGGLDDPASLRSRSEIRRIGVEIEALTRHPDLHWEDASDPDPDTRRFRKFKLTGDITPPNLGLIGIKDLEADSTPPGAPAQPQLYPGHCGGLYIAWSPNPPTDEVAYYRIRYGTAPGNLDGQRAVDGLQYYLGGLLHGVPYYVALQAIDAAGNQSPLGPLASTTTTNDTIPEMALGLTASTTFEGHVDLAWGAVTENTAPTPGDPYSPRIRELAGYRVYRGGTSGFVPAASNRIADESTLPALPTPVFVDDQVVGCRNYYYKVTAVDRCGLEGSPSGEANGRSFSAVKPRRPELLEVFYGGMTNDEIHWVAVRENENDDPVYINDYKLYRTNLVAESYTPTVPDDFNFRAVVSGATEYVDPIIKNLGETVWYLVTATDDCGNESDFSDPARAYCSFSGRVTFQEPAYNAQVWGDTQVTVEVVDAGTTYTELRILVKNEDSGDTTTFTFPGPGPVWVSIWDADPAVTPEGPYRVYAEVDQQNGLDICTSSTSTRVILAQP